MVELAEETRLPSWYEVPTTNVLKLPGLSSIKDGYHSPGSLNHSLFEERRRNHPLASNKSIGINQSAADDTRKDDTETTAKHLREIADDSTTSHRTQICHDLRYRDRVRREAVLVFQHGWVEVLTAVGHEVHASHQQDKVDQKKPMPLESNLAFLDESLANIIPSSPDTLTLDIRISLR